MPRFQVILSDADDQRFAAFCAERGHKKSTLAARLIREHLDRERYAHQPDLLPAPARRAKPARANP